MKKKIILHAMALLIAGTFAACKKDKDDQQPEPDPAPVVSRVVKYEITGNYTGKFNVIYTNESGANQTDNDVSLPWSKELTVQASVSSVSFLASTPGNPASVGVPGQKATGKLFTGGIERKSATQTADNNGLIILSGFSYVFPQ